MLILSSATFVVLFIAAYVKYIIAYKIDSYSMKVDGKVLIISVNKIKQFELQSVHQYRRIDQKFLVKAIFQTGLNIYNISY